MQGQEGGVPDHAGPWEETLHWKGSSPGEPSGFGGFSWLSCQPQVKHWTGYTDSHVDGYYNLVQTGEK